MAAFISETFSDGVWSSTYTHTSSVQELVRNITQKDIYRSVFLLRDII